MKLLYENTIEDLIALYRYHTDHSPTNRLINLFLFRILPICIFLFNFLLGPLDAIIIGATLGVLLVFAGPWFMRFINEQYLRWLYREGSTKGMIGEHELELTENDLIERTLCGETHTRLRTIERVVTTRSYTFIYLSAVTAHIIPQNAVQDGDYEAFVEGLKRRMAEKHREQGIRADRLRDERFFER